MVRGTSLARGATLTSMGVLLAVLGAAAAGLVIWRPRFAFGPGQAAAQAPALTTSQHTLVSRLKELLQESKAVLAVHPRGERPFEEIVLWLDDSENPGVLDRRELAMLSHSRIMQTLTLFMSAASTKPGGPPVDPKAAAREGFCDFWRSDPMVAGVVIAGDVQDVRCIPSGMNSKGWPSWRVELIWAADSVDGPMTAASIDAVAVHPPETE